MSFDPIDAIHSTKKLLAQLSDVKNQIGIDAVNALVKAGAKLDEVLSDLVTNHDIDPVESVKLLRQAGADVTKTHAGSTIYYAAQNNQPLVLKYLLDQFSGLIDSPGYDGNTPLMAACAYSPLCVVKMLLDSGADLSLKNEQGGTALHFAAHSEEGGVLDEIIQRGACLYEQDNEGHTALHKCAIWGLVRSAGTLIKRGMDVDALSHDGSTSLWLAVMKKRSGVAKVLLTHNADPTIPKDGVTPINLAKGIAGMVHLVEEMEAWVNRNGLEISRDSSARSKAAAPSASASASALSLSTIPLELIENVTCYLPTNDVLSLTVLNKHFHNIGKSQRIETHLTGVHPPLKAEQLILSFSNQRICDFIKQRPAELKSCVDESQPLCSRQLWHKCDKFDNSQCIQAAFEENTPGFKEFICTLLVAASESTRSVRPSDKCHIVEHNYVANLSWVPFRMRCFNKPAPRNALQCTFRYCLHLMFQYRKVVPNHRVGRVVFCRQQIYRAYKLCTRRTIFHNL